MQVKTLGRTGLRVGVVGLGAAQIGSAVSEEETRQAMEIVWAVAERQPEGGRMLIDSAGLYGQGRSEEIIRLALRERPELAERVLVTTKVGHCPRGFQYTYEETMSRVQCSLARLGFSTLPLVYVHDAFTNQFDAVMGSNGALAALRRLQEEGLVEHIGVAINDPQINAPFIETGEFEAAVVPEAFSLINRVAEERIFAAAERFNMGIVIATPVEKGLMAIGARQARQQALEFGARTFSDRLLDHVEKIEDLCERYGVSLLAANLQYITRHPQVTAAIPGAETPEQALANLDAADEAIPEAFWPELEPLVRTWEWGVDR